MTPTTWFAGNVAPIYPGIYDRKYRINEPDDGDGEFGRVNRSRWDGCEWKIDVSADGVTSCYQPWEKDGDDFQWRGVTEPQDEFWKQLNGKWIAIGDMGHDHCQNVLRLLLKRGRKRQADKAALFMARYGSPFKSITKVNAEVLDHFDDEDRKWGSGS